MSSIVVSQGGDEVGVGKKHGSYARYLAKKKAPYIIKSGEIVQSDKCTC